MDFLRGMKFGQRSVSEGSTGEQKSASPGTTSPRTPTSPFFTNASSATPTPPSNLKPTNRPRPSLPITEALPTDPSLLEGLLNHRTSQLKRLADRVESINEWIEMDGIVLARMVDEVTQRVEREEEGKAKAKEDGDGAVTHTHSSLTLWGISIADVSEVGVPSKNQATPHHPPRARTPIVHFQSPEARHSGDAVLTTEERVSANCNIRDARDRIRSMKKWRKELDRSVFWQREEHSRIEKAMGKQRSDAELGQDDGMGAVGGGGAWGIGGKTWERGSGRLPTQVEWEVMFGSQRLRWDEKGAKPNFETG